MGNQLQASDNPDKPGKWLLKGLHWLFKEYRQYRVQTYYFIQCGIAVLKYLISCIYAKLSEYKQADAKHIFAYSWNWDWTNWTL